MNSNKEAPAFTFELCANCVRVLDRSVRRSDSSGKRESIAMAAGQRIQDGSREKSDVELIAKWKAARAARHINDSRNDQVIVRVLDTAVSPNASDADKLRALTTLVGVNVAMASAVLTCIDSDNYTVIDVKALDALRVSYRTIGKGLYLRYLEFCRSTAAELGVELRQLDRALWKSGSIV